MDVLKIKEVISVLIVTLMVICGTAYYGYIKGIDHQKEVYASAQVKANTIVVNKNITLEKIPAKEAALQVVYQDRIVFKYQNVIKEVIKYENSKEGSTYLDSNFVRLHDYAASPTDDQIKITEPAIAVDGTVAPVEKSEVTTGQAIKVVSDNYKAYYACQVKLDGWKRFYADVQKSVNE